jgi:protease-4
MNKAPSGSVAVIPVRGELMKYNQFCGPAGMQTIGQRIQEADVHRNISSIMLIVDSPGGTVDGTKALGNIIKGTTKPTTGLVDGMAASGGKWLISNCDRVIATTEIDQVGSIGVMNSFIDMQPYWESLGIKFHEVYSDLSKDKNRLFREMRHGDYENYKKAVLDPLAQEFRDIIKTNRPNVKDEHLTGKMFFAKDVVGTLIDEIASFDDAIRITADMAKPKKQVQILK